MANARLGPQQVVDGHPPDDAQPAFDPDTLERIASILGLSTGDADAAKRSRLRRELGELPENIAFFISGDVIPRPAQGRDRLARLERACERPPANAGSKRISDPRSVFEQVGDTARLLILWQFALAVSPARPEEAIEDGRARMAVEAAFATPAVLQSAARAARENLERGIVPGRGGNRHKPDWPLQQILLLLGTLYFELTGDRPGISTDPATEKPSGRFLAFLTACLPPLGWQLGADAIRHHFRAAREAAKIGRPLEATDIFDSAI
jgi:hypothetical protein